MPHTFPLWKTKSTGIEWTWNRGQINPGRQAIKKGSLLRAIDFLPFSPPPFLYMG